MGSMTGDGQAGGGGRAGWMAVALLAAALAGGAAYWRAQGEAPKATKTPPPVPVVGATVRIADVPVRLQAKGIASAVQAVEVRARISATIRAVQVQEGQMVRAGQRLFSLDVRSEEANLGKAEAQVLKSQADLANAERTLQRQRELFAAHFIAQTVLDAAQSQVDALRAQVAADQAARAASRVTYGFGEIIAPIDGRLGAIAVYPGSLVQPSGPALVSIARLDPIEVSFTLPERELAALRQALATGAVPVTVAAEGGGAAQLRGQVSFIDNTVDAASGTIRVKASFANADQRLWPGMFLTVTLAPRTLSQVAVVPAQAVQTGPEQTFVYVLGDGGKAVAQPVQVRLIQDGEAVIQGVDAGTRVVIEGAQNLRSGSVVVESSQSGRSGGRGSTAAGGS